MAHMNTIVTVCDGMAHMNTIVSVCDGMAHMNSSLSIYLLLKHDIASNELRGKVVFSPASVSHSVHRWGASVSGSGVRGYLPLDPRVGCLPLGPHPHGHNNPGHIHTSSSILWTHPISTHTPGQIPHPRGHQASYLNAFFLIESS